MTSTAKAIAEKAAGAIATKLDTDVGVAKIFNVRAFEPILLPFIAQAQREAIEEAAKIAEGHFIFGHSVAGPGFAAKCAAAIRKLIETPAGESNES